MIPSDAKEKSVRAEGFAPVYSAQSKLLILGSFPSVKSRAVSFYYGNPQNRFWRTVSGFFGEDLPEDVAQKREFLLRRGIALWDIVTDCYIVGSSDASIRREQIADIPALMQETDVRHIYCNGGKAYELFVKAYPQYLPITRKLSSTSPANPRFSEREWHAALQEAFL